MARIIVTADPTAADDQPVLLEESVSSVHLSTGHAAAQLVERLAWAIADAEDAERPAPYRGPRHSRVVPRKQGTARVTVR
jgi:hypothetical protein